jgi:tetratricopeptide (TPR) repeat protein
MADAGTPGQSDRRIVASSSDDNQAMVRSEGSVADLIAGLLDGGPVRSSLSSERPLASEIESTEEDVDLDEESRIRQQALARDPENAKLWFEYGVALGGLGHCRKAVSAFEKAVELAPQHAKAWCWLGRMRDRIEALTSAIAAYEEAVTIAPDWAEAWCDLGVALGKSGRCAEAHRALDRAISLNAEDAFSWTTKGCLLADEGQYEWAVEAFRQAATLEPSSADICWRAGDAYQKAGQKEASLEWFQRACRCDPTDGDAWTSVSSIQLAMGNPEGALAAAEKAIAVRGEWPEGYSLKAAALSKMGQFDAALCACDQSLAISPSESTMLLKATMLRDAGRLDECVRYVDGLAEKGEAVDEVLLLGAAADCQLGRLDKACRTSAAVHKRDARNLQALFMWAYTTAKQGAPAKALDRVCSALRDHPARAELWYVKAIVEALLKRDDDMLASLRKAISLAPEIADQVQTDVEFAPYLTTEAFRAATLRK